MVVLSNYREGFPSNWYPERRDMFFFGIVIIDILINSRETLVFINFVGSYLGSSPALFYLRVHSEK